MPLTEESERIGGAALLGVPAFDAFVWALDNYARIELLVRLQEQLPAFLLSPVTSFLCMCLGLGLLYRAHQNHLARIARPSGRGLVDTSGTELRSVGKPKWLLHVVIVFLLALVATPVLAIAYSLAYRGNPPIAPPTPRPPSIAYAYYRKSKPPAAPQVSTGPITQGPCSNVQIGGSNNEATANCGQTTVIKTYSYDGSETKLISGGSIQVVPSNADPRFVAIEQEISNGQESDALADAKILIKSEPLWATPHILAGIVYVNIGKLRDAKSELARARELVPPGYEYESQYTVHVQHLDEIIKKHEPPSH